MGRGEPAHRTEGGPAASRADGRRAERLTLPSLWRLRREVAALPTTLGVLSGFAALRGDETTSRALDDAGTLLEGLAPRERGVVLRTLARDPSTPAAGLTREAVEVIASVLEHGGQALVEQARARLAPDLARLLSVPGVTLDDVVAVHRRTGAVTAGDLAAAVGTIGHPAADVDDTLRHRIEAALPALRRGHPRLPLGRAWRTLERLREDLAPRVPGLQAMEPSGSARRFEPTVGDLELLACADDPSAALESLHRTFDPPAVLHRGTRVLGVVVDTDAVVVRFVSPSERPFAQVYYTGSAAHVKQLQQRAVARGLRLSAARLATPGGQKVPCASEADVYAALDLDFVAPELRHGDWELEQAARRTLPHLVSRHDIRGDLHVHTLWSDGRDSVEAMVRAARALGYEYVAITDHSPRAAASRVLSLERLERQREDVESIRRRLPDITVLHGAEVDILPDGSLDFPDAVLDRLDIVLASLHEPAGQGPDRLLDRYLGAMRHPRVHVITHPANRLVGRDDGYSLDYDVLFREAARTGTVLEVDGGPGHLDLDGHLARRAAAGGVMLSIDSDCHSAARLGQQMALGIGTARRGGISPGQVLNTRPVDEVLSYLAGKPGRLASLPR